MILLLGGCSSYNNDAVSNNQPKQAIFTKEDFEKLYPSWVYLGSEVIDFGRNVYAVVVMGQPDYKDDFGQTVNIRISVCKKADQWLEIWHLPKDLQGSPVDENSLKQYTETFLIDLVTIKDNYAALIVANVFVGGAHGTTQVAVIVLDSNGKCSLQQLDSSGIMSVEKEDDHIKITGEGAYGVHKLFLENGKYRQEIIPLSKMAPADSVKAKFIVGGYERLVYPAETGTITMKVGQTIAFIPANEETEKLFNEGKISIYTDAWNGPPLTICEANRLDGNSYTFDKAGTYHFLLIFHNDWEDNYFFEESSDEREPTFTVVVQQ